MKKFTYKKEGKKLRGRYYTPKMIADFLVKWAITSKKDLVLEPCCGDGIFLQSAIERLSQIGASSKEIIKNIYAIEIDENEAQEAIDKFANLNIAANKAKVFIGDFFYFCQNHLLNKKSFDCIIGNPPFIRYQDFPEEQRKIAFNIMRIAGLHPNRLTNIWIPFLVSSSLLLKDKGRVGMVIPAELFQVNYASETREYLSKFFNKINIILFKKLVFEGIQQEVILFLAEKNKTNKHEIKVIEIKDIHELNKIKFNNNKKKAIILDNSSEKWTLYYLDNFEVNFIREIREGLSVPLSREYIDVDVGVVTGQNKFFLLSKDTVKKYKLENYVKRIIGKSVHLKGLFFTDSDWGELIDKNQPVYLLYPPDKDFHELPYEIRRYLDIGLNKGYHLGYKCRIRKKWWVVPSVWVPDAFMLRQVHSFPKIVLNKSDATSTDTLHRVKFLNGIDGKILAASFLNSLTFAFSEITGRSYGGGVLTFEPSEAETLPIPVNGIEKVDIEKIDYFLRMGDIEKVLNITDPIFLKKGLGLTNVEIKTLRRIWIKLRNRRINRG